MKQIPNIITYCNLFFGCIAIVYIVQPGLVPCIIQIAGTGADVTNLGTQYISIPEQMFMASLFIGLAAVVDFLDGFVARWMKATSPSGTVRFTGGCGKFWCGALTDHLPVPSLIICTAGKWFGCKCTFSCYRLFLLPVPALTGLQGLIVIQRQTTYFQGIAIPANGLLIASFPLIYWTSNFSFVIQLLISPWFWYAVILLMSYLMISKKPMLALKFSKHKHKKIIAVYNNRCVAIYQRSFIQWLAVPLSFLVYVILSLFINR
jgi:CDP-diacylglycerol--serine O-phosphatidyltransferase